MRINNGRAVCKTQLYAANKDLLMAVTSITDNLPRRFRNSIGGSMIKSAVGINSCFIRAYVSSDKAYSIEKLSEVLSHYETLQVLLTLAFDKRWIYGQNKQNTIAKTMAVIGKQTTALRNSLANHITAQQ